MDTIVPYDQIGQVAPGPWKNANPSAGQRGSIINADFFTAVLGELLAIQDEAGFTRDGTNLKQVMNAIRSGKLSAFADTGTADALIVTPYTAYATIALGTEITVLKGAAANATATPTLAVGAITHPITKEDGSALAPGDLPAHGLITVKYDGSTAFRVVGLRKSDTTPTIPATALWHVGVDTSGSAATIVATVTPAVPARLTDAAYLIIPAHACAGATQINVGFGAPVTLTRNDGTPLQPGDYAAGQPLVIVDDGTLMRVADLLPSQVTAAVTTNITTIAPEVLNALQSLSSFTPVVVLSDLPYNVDTVIKTLAIPAGTSYVRAQAQCAFRNDTGTQRISFTSKLNLTDNLGNVQYGQYIGGAITPYSVSGAGTQSEQQTSFEFKNLDKTKTYTLNYTGSKIDNYSPLIVLDGYIYASFG